MFSLAADALLWPWKPQPPSEHISTMPHDQYFAKPSLPWEV
jgi:hypothetical protein